MQQLVNGKSGEALRGPVWTAQGNFPGLTRLHTAGASVF